MKVFYKGWLGWKMDEYSKNIQGNSFTYSTDMNRFYGEIPKNFVAKTQKVKINGKDAKVIKLNELTKFWFTMEKNNGQNENNNVYVRL